MHSYVLNKLLILRRRMMFDGGYCIRRNEKEFMWKVSFFVLDGWGIEIGFRIIIIVYSIIYSRHQKY